MQDEDTEVRLSVAESLGFIGGDRAIQALKAALSDEDEEVSGTAAEELRLLTRKE